MIRTENLQPADFVRILQRRWKWPAGFILACAVGGGIVGLRLPNQYRSETTVLVVPQRVPESYVRSTVTSRIEERVRSLREQILSRTRLERVIDEFGLYAKEQARLPMEQIVEDMQESVGTRIVREDAFQISFTAQEPLTAQRVASRLAQMFVQENVRDREVQASSTNQFLETELEQARRTLTEQEARVESFRLANSGEMPEQVASNMQAIQNIELQLQTLVQSLASDRERRATLERQLADATSPVPVLEGTATPTADAPTTLAGQVEQARRTVAELSARLTAVHPDLIQARQTLERLEQRRAAELGATTGPRPPAGISAAELGRQRRIDDLNAQLAAVSRQIEEKSGEEARLRASTLGYRQRVEIAPRRQTELVALTRDYETIQRQYRGLLEKYEESKVAANLERQQVGEQFRVLDPARLPERPVSPNRPLLLLLGAAVGLALGLLAIVVIEFRDNTLHSTADATALLSLPVLATVPAVNPRDGSRIDRAWALGATAALLLLSFMIARNPGAATSLRPW